METIALIGSGGHCKSCIDVVETSNQYRILGVVVPKNLTAHQQTSEQYPILGTDDDLKKIVSESGNILIAIGQLGKGELRASLFQRALDAGAIFPTIVSMFAHTSNRSSVGEGTIIMHMAMVNSGAVIGANCIINSMALVEHDVVIGNNVHVATGARINGNVTIGSNCFVGSGTIIKQGVTIGKNTVISAGQFVRNSLPENTVFGIHDEQ